MKQIEFTTAEREALQSGRFHHPHPRVQRKMEALYLKSQGLEPAQISRLCAMSKPTFYRYLHAYRQGGIAKLPEVPFHRCRSQLADDRTSIEADFRQHPPASVAEAVARHDLLLEMISGERRSTRRLSHTVTSRSSLTRNDNANVPRMGLATRAHEGVERKHQRRERPYVKATPKGILMHQERGDKSGLWCTGGTLEVHAAWVGETRVECVRCETGGHHA